MSRAWIAGIALGLASCAHYAPAPQDPEAFPVALDARRLDEKQPAAAWSRADLLNAALARNPQLAEARAKHLTAMAAARTARLAPGLALTLTAEYADEKPHWGGGVAPDLPLDARGRRTARLTTADLQALQAWYDYGEAAWTVRTALAKARAELESARSEQGLAARLVAVRRERALRLDRRVAAGEDDRALALVALAELSAAERRLAAARGLEEGAVVTLAKALGVGPQAVRSLAFATSDASPAPAGIAKWRRDAALSRSDILRAIADYDLAEAALRLEVAKQYPQVSIGPGYMYDHGVNKLPFNLTLALPNYDLNRHAIAQAEAARTAAGRSLELAQAHVLASVDAAAAALQAASASAERIAAVELPAARRAALNVARATRIGEADRVDDLAAEAAALDAELNLLEARRTARTAAADLEDALRRSFDPAETAALETALTRPGGAR